MQKYRFNIGRFGLLFGTDYIGSYCLEGPIHFGIGIGPGVRTGTNRPNASSAYSLLPKYCDEILRSNPGSTVKLEVDPTTSRFKRVFICFAVSALGFAYCRPLLGLDGTHLKHTYQGNIRRF